MRDLMPGEWDVCVSFSFSLTLLPSIPLSTQFHPTAGPSKFLCNNESVLKG